MDPLHISVVLLILLFLWNGRHRWGRNLPPALRRVPLLGHLPILLIAFQFDNASTCIRRWCQKLSESSCSFCHGLILTQSEDTDILYFEVAGFSALVIDKYDAAVEILGKRSWNYSDR
jgi:hypothetical protein